MFYTHTVENRIIVLVASTTTWESWKKENEGRIQMKKDDTVDLKLTILKQKSLRKKILNDKE